MISWKEFSASESDLASAGERLLFQYGVGLAYLATIRHDGGPRLHPVSPVLSEGHLYVFVLPDSPKRADLSRDPRFALQTFPPPDFDFTKEGEEFYVTGCAEPVGQYLARASVVADARQHVSAEEFLFELKITRVMHTIWKTGDTGLQPSRRHWRAAESKSHSAEPGA